MIPSNRIPPQPINPPAHHPSSTTAEMQERSTMGLTAPFPRTLSRSNLPAATFIVPPRLRTGHEKVQDSAIIRLLDYLDTNSAQFHVTESADHEGGRTLNWSNSKAASKEMNLLTLHIGRDNWLRSLTMIREGQPMPFSARFEPKPAAPAAFSRPPGWLPAPPEPSRHRVFSTSSAPGSPRSHDALRQQARNEQNGQGIAAAIGNALTRFGIDLDLDRQYALADLLRAAVSLSPAALQTEVHAALLPLYVAQRMPWSFERPQEGERVISPAELTRYNGAFPTHCNILTVDGAYIDAAADMVYFYLEQQTERSCAQHALNAMVGGPRFSLHDLARRQASARREDGQSLTDQEIERIADDMRRNGVFMETVQGALHDAQIPTHMFRYIPVDGPDGTPALDAAQCELLNQLQVDRMVLQIDRVLIDALSGQEIHLSHYMAFQRENPAAMRKDAEDWVALDSLKGQLQYIRPSEYLLSDPDIVNFTALWPQQRLVMDGQPHGLTRDRSESRLSYVENQMDASKGKNVDRTVTVNVSWPPIPDENDHHVPRWGRNSEQYHLPNAMNPASDVAGTASAFTSRGQAPAFTDIIPLNEVQGGIEQWLRAQNELVYGDAIRFREVYQFIETTGIPLADLELDAKPPIGLSPQSKKLLYVSLVAHRDKLQSETQVQPTSPMPSSDEQLNWAIRKFAHDGRLTIAPHILIALPPFVLRNAVTQAQPQFRNSRYDLLEATDRAILSAPMSSTARVLRLLSIKVLAPYKGRAWSMHRAGITSNPTNNFEPSHDFHSHFYNFYREKTIQRDRNGNERTRPSAFTTQMNTFFTSLEGRMGPLDDSPLKTVEQTKDALLTLIKQWNPTVKEKNRELQTMLGRLVDYLKHGLPSAIVGRTRQASRSPDGSVAIRDES